MSEPMEVQRIRTEGGSHIEPPLDQAWDDLTKLRWHAAVVRCDKGVDVQIEPADSRMMINGEWVQIRGVYDARRNGGSSGAYDFREMWAFLNGVSFGRERPSDRPEGSGE